MQRLDLMKRLDLLIVEDDEMVARAEHRMLKGLWNSVTFARDAEAGMAYIKSGDFDLVLTDWDCPKGGGKHIVTNSTIPTVVYTGNSEVPSICPETKVIIKGTARKLLCRGTIRRLLCNALIDAYLEFELGNSNEK